MSYHLVRSEIVDGNKIRSSEVAKSALAAKEELVSQPLTNVFFSTETVLLILLATIKSGLLPPSIFPITRNMVQLAWQN
jgi:hypothetical protein